MKNLAQELETRFSAESTASDCTLLRAHCTQMRANVGLLRADACGGTSTYAYDRSGNRTSRSLPDGVTATAAFDALSPVW